MPVESFNDRASPNGPVSGQGTRGGATPPAVTASTAGRPSALVQKEGTEDPDAVTTKQSPPLSTPSGGGENKHPPIDYYKDSVV